MDLPGLDQHINEFRAFLQKAGQLPFLEREALHGFLDYQVRQFGKQFPSASVKTYQMIFSALAEIGFYARDKEILEIGTGFNLGVLLLAWLAGARKVTGIDAYHHEMGPAHDFILSALNQLAGNAGILVTTPDAASDFFERFARMISKDQNGRYIFNPGKLEFRFPHSVEALPFADSSFDLVYTSAAFEHFMEPDAAVHEMARVTRPGGFSFHIVDLRDHRNFSRPLEFLKLPQAEWTRVCRTTDTAIRTGSGIPRSCGSLANMGSR